MSYLAITRRIRACESEVPAQLVLEYAIRRAVEQERERCAKVCEELPTFKYDDPGEIFAMAIRALGGE